MTKSFKLLLNKKDYKKREIRLKNLFIFWIVLQMGVFFGSELLLELNAFDYDFYFEYKFFIGFVSQLYLSVLFAFVRLKIKLQKMHKYEHDLHRKHLNQFMLFLTITFLIILGQNVVPLFFSGDRDNITDLNEYY
jgi:hypothetical protein